MPYPPLVSNSLRRADTLEYLTVRELRPQPPALGALFLKFFHKAADFEIPMTRNSASTEISDLARAPL